MNFKKIIPTFIKDYLRMLKLMHKYPGRIIESSQISDNVILGVCCRVGREVAISKGVNIGDYTYINSGTVIGSGTIGKYCSVGYYCQIGMHEHPTDCISTSPYLYGKNNIFNLPVTWDDFQRPTVIGCDVWVGSHAIILQGVSIGHGAVIAAGSVVTKDVLPYKIVGGVPAKLIRNRFDEKIVQELLDIKWWDLPPNQILAMKNELSHILKPGRNRI